MKFTLDLQPHEIDSLLLILDSQLQSNVSSFRKILIGKLMGLLIQSKDEVVIKNLGLMKK